MANTFVFIAPKYTNFQDFKERLILIIFFDYKNNTWELRPHMGCELSIMGAKLLWLATI